MIVFYDKKTGQIAHIYEEICLPGSKPRSQSAMRIAALKGMQDQETRSLGTLDIPPSKWKSDINYRVDLKKRTLVQVKQDTTEKKLTPKTRRIRK